MHETPLKALQLYVGISLACLRRTTVRGFAGCGQSRRREVHLIPQMAETIAGDISTKLVFSRDGVQVIRSRVAHHIGGVLGDVPADMARAWAGVDATARDGARHAIAARIVQRLSERYTVTVQTRAVIVPAANVWCGLSDAKDET
ncbi:hypothetical protein CFBP6626_24040 (plasmid) [Agrobacterium tumefaciens]|nr:hypothetical protein CFBP6626_24040 [Agrobacterium tumefaciens]CUX64860.1 conserved hypothetical protein [Agrobacterium genomosp. 5 str. CFBP 6626]